MLELRNLSVAISAVQILREVSLAVPDGAMIGLIGRNGAGKTTLMKTLMGLLKATSGSVQLDGRDLLAAPTHARVRLGIGYMPEDRRLIPDLTVEENVLVPAWAARLADARERLERVYELIPEMRAGPLPTWAHCCRVHLLPGLPSATFTAIRFSGAAASRTSIMLHSRKTSG